MNGNETNKILVVDDEPSMIDLMQLMLAQLGYEVSTASDGKQGLRIIESEEPDLIITDIIMPDMEGIEFIRSLAKERKGLPVIVMSGHPVGMRFLNIVRAFGAKAALQKPFTSEQLSEVIAAAGCAQRMTFG